MTAGANGGFTEHLGQGSPVKSASYLVLSPPMRAGSNISFELVNNGP